MAAVHVPQDVKRRPGGLMAKFARTVAVVCLFLSAQAARQVAMAGEGFDPMTLKPFTTVQQYQGMDTGLYPDGKNEMPEAHRKAGEQIAATIGPLDAQGKPGAQQGRILALVLGHSNCVMYFEALQAELRKNAAELHPRFELLNAAVGGQQLPEIRQLQGKVWDKATGLLSRPGYSAQQVQILFLHTTYHGWKNTNQMPPRPFPETMRKMEADIAAVLAHCVKLYPNLRLAYLTSDGFRHFTGFEPHVWQEAFALKWLIERQIKGEQTAVFSGPDRRLPWLEWGPYVWDNTWDRSYFTDGVHPAPQARAIFAQKYWQHLKADSVARGWLLKAQP